MSLLHRMLPLLIVSIGVCNLRKIHRHRNDSLKFARNHFDGRRIVGGREVRDNEALWYINLISYFPQESDGATPSVVCGASFIGHCLVITAAHCLMDLETNGSIVTKKTDPSIVILQYTSSNSWSSGQIHQVLSYIFMTHESYIQSYRTFDMFDIGLVWFKPPPLRNGSPCPLPMKLILPQRGDSIKYNFTKVAGSGFTKLFLNETVYKSLIRESIIRIVTLPVLRGFQCFSGLKATDGLKRKYMFCSESNRVVPKGIALGDSGTAAVGHHTGSNSSNVIIGVTSTYCSHDAKSARSCLGSDEPLTCDSVCVHIKSQFVNIEKFLSWIMLYTDPVRWYSLPHIGSRDRFKSLELQTTLS